MFDSIERLTLNVQQAYVIAVLVSTLEHFVKNFDNKRLLKFFLINI